MSSRQFHHGRRQDERRDSVRSLADTMAAWLLPLYERRVTFKSEILICLQFRHIVSFRDKRNKENRQKLAQDAPSSCNSSCIKLRCTRPAEGRHVQSFSTHVLLDRADV